MNDTNIMMIPDDLQGFIAFDDNHTFHQVAVFLFLWGRIEHLLFNDNANARVINKLDIDIKNIEGKEFFKSAKYFIERYKDVNKLNRLFNGRDKRFMSNVKNMILNNEIKINCLMLIIWRLRCNLFHGVKIGYGLHDQCMNFFHANNILKYLLSVSAGLNLHRNGSGGVSTPPCA